jgi:TetR/AcrR family transcriptional regulator, regulator of autoinduction and epiphytic fitness
MGAPTWRLIDSPFHAVGAMDAVKRELLGLVAKYLDEAVDKGQLPASSHQGFVVRAFWDFTTLTILYWLNDDSESFTRSSEFIDHGLDLYVALVQSGIADKAMQLGGFLLKNHLHEHLNLIGNLFGSLGNLRKGGNGVTP